MNTQPTDEQPIDLSGRVLGPYKLRARIGVGGTATVYRAEDCGTKAEVAIKVLHRGSDRTTILRFQKEISLARNLCEQSNRHLARIVQDGQDDGLYWVAMELMRGKSVRDLLIAAPASGLRWEAAAFIVQNICGAVATLHELEVVHRDLKPENIFLSRTSTGQLWVTLLDLGIAKEFSAEPKTQEGMHLTDRNELPGTGPYMAPERVLGGPCSPATDQYSLGVLLYECLHRQLPYPPSANYTALRAQVHGSLADLSWKKVPDELKKIVLRAMSKTRDERFPDVLDMGRALHGVLDGAREWVDGKGAAMELFEAPAEVARARHVERPPDEKTTATSFQKPRGRGDLPPASEAPSETQPWVEATSPAHTSGRADTPARAPTPQAPPDHILARPAIPARAQPLAKPDILATARPSTKPDMPGRAPAHTPALAKVEPRLSGTNPRTDMGSRAISESEATLDERVQNALLVRHGPRIFRIMRITFRITMVAIVGMMALTGDPQWTEVQKRLTDSTKDEDGKTNVNGAPLALRPEVPHAAASPSISTSVSPSAPQNPERIEVDTPSAPQDPERLAVDTKPTMSSPPKPDSTNKGPKSAPGKGEPTSIPPARAAPIAGADDETISDLLPVKVSGEKLRNRAVSTAQARVHEICPLSPESPAGGGKVCVDLVINAQGKPQLGSIKATEPADLSFVDKRGADCVIQVVKAHVDLKQMSPMPSSFEHCFTVKP